jgi:hypothetical protein
MLLINRTQNKIISRIEKIAKKGRNNKLEYTKYVNELINKEQYYILLNIIDTYFQLPLYHIEDVPEFINLSWYRILINTHSDILVRIKRILDNNDVYQIGNDIYTNDNVLLGSIFEFDVKTDTFRYYLKNKEFSKLIKEHKTFINVLKNNILTTIDQDDNNFSEKQNYINRFMLAIELLKS